MHPSGGARLLKLVLRPHPHNVPRVIAPKKGVIASAEYAPFRLEKKPVPEIVADGRHQQKIEVKRHRTANKQFLVLFYNPERLFKFINIFLRNKKAKLHCSRKQCILLPKKVYLTIRFLVYGSGFFILGFLLSNHKTYKRRRIPIFAKRAAKPTIANAHNIDPRITTPANSDCL